MPIISNLNPLAQGVKGIVSVNRAVVAADNGLIKGLVPVSNGGFGGSPLPFWILANGIWEDTGIWDDNATWNDS